MKEAKLKKLLGELGLSSIETEAYLVLVQQPGLTGYKIAGLISKPVANTYTALNHLESKGLVVYSEAGGTKAYTAIDFHEYTDRLESELKEKKEAIIEELKSLRVIQKDFGSYNLSDRNQVYERGRSLIKSAEDVLLIDIFPLPFRELKETIEKKALDEKIEMKVKLYEDEALECPNKIVAYNGKKIVDSWIGNWLIICKDTTEVLIASFSKESDKLLHAIWSTDPFICFIVYNGLANEFELIEILNHQHRHKNIDSDIIERISNCYQTVYNYEMVAGNRIMRDVFGEKHNEEKE